MAERLLLRKKGKVLSKQIQRLLHNSKLASIANRTHNSRVSEILNDLNESAVHLIARDNLVANSTAFGTVAVDPATVHDGLSSEPISDEAWQAEIGHRRNDALFACGQRQIGIISGEYIVHYQQMLAPATDSKGLDYSDPRLLDGGSYQVVRRSIITGNAAKHFVFVAHRVLKIKQERDFALIEMG